MSAFESALQLPSPDAQLLAVLIAIRAARGGTGRVSGNEVRSLRLDNTDRAVSDLRALGWQIPDLLLDRDADTPALVTVPALAAGAGDHPLPLGKEQHSRVSSWITHTLAAPLVARTPPAARLAALFLTGYASVYLNGTLPHDLPQACRGRLPDLMTDGFLTHLDEDQYRLNTSMRYLTGRLPHQADPDDSTPRRRPHVGLQPLVW
ncbi:hypothetical protein ACFC0C_27090 [Streptomyces sp. NPDC056178]|uniref:hypothetical protein n=1 Tax=unclassified Streptomyces TaxID=2593676 RepID=UPI0035E1473F